jgi:hypothetical protein
MVVGGRWHIIADELNFFFETGAKALPQSIY